MTFDITEYDRAVAKEAHRIYFLHEHANAGLEDYSPAPAVPLIIAMLVRTGWEPDPDINEANKLLDEFDEKSDRELVMAALKRGRELAELKWIKFGSEDDECPIDRESYVWVKNVYSFVPKIGQAKDFNWRVITAYCEINFPK